MLVGGLVGLEGVLLLVPCVGVARRCRDGLGGRELWGLVLDGERCLLVVLWCGGGSIGCRGIMLHGLEGRWV